MRRRSDATRGRSIGMKSTTSAIPDSDRNRVTRIAVSGMYICLVVRAGVTGANAKRPPRRSSSRDANTLGESNRGQQNQSIVPSAATSAAL
jgi:hypothetical protein